MFTGTEGQDLDIYFEATVQLTIEVSFTIKSLGNRIFSGTVTEFED